MSLDHGHLLSARQIFVPRNLRFDHVDHAVRGRDAGGDQATTEARAAVQARRMRRHADAAVLGIESANHQAAAKIWFINTFECLIGPPERVGLGVQRPRRIDARVNQYQGAIVGVSKVLLRLAPCQQYRASNINRG